MSFGTFMGPQPAEETEKSVLEALGQQAETPAAATQTDTSPEGQIESMVKRWKLALHGAATDPNGRQRIEAILKGSEGPGFRRVAQISGDLDRTDKANEDRAREQVIEEVGLEKTGADIVASQAATQQSAAQARRANAEAATLESLQPGAADVQLSEIELNKARARLRDAQAGLASASATTTGKVASNLTYVHGILKGTFPQVDDAVLLVKAQELLDGSVDRNTLQLKLFQELMKQSLIQNITPDQALILSADMAATIGQNILGDLEYEDLRAEMTAKQWQDFLALPDDQKATKASAIRERMQQMLGE